MSFFSQVQRTATNYAPTDTFRGQQQRGYARPTTPDDPNADPTQNPNAVNRQAGDWNWNRSGQQGEVKTPQGAATQGATAAPWNQNPTAQSAPSAPSPGGVAKAPPTPTEYVQPGQTGQAAPPPPAPGEATPVNPANQTGLAANAGRSGADGINPNTGPSQGATAAPWNAAPPVSQMAAPSPSIDIHGGMPSPSAPPPSGVTAAPWNQSSAASTGTPTPGSVAPGAATYWGANSPASASAPTATSGPRGFDLGNYLQSMLGISTLPGTPQTQAYGSGSGYTGGINVPGLIAQRLNSGLGTSVSPQTQQALNQQLQDPTGFDSSAVKNSFADMSRNIDDQYALKQKDLKDEMARRGLTDSSIGAGRLSDLNIGQRSALSQGSTQLAIEQAHALQQGRNAAIGQSANADQYGNAATTGMINQLLGAGQQGFGNSAQLDQLRAALSGQKNNQAMGWAGQLQGYGNDAFNHDVTTNSVNQNALDSQTQVARAATGRA